MSDFRTRVIGLTGLAMAFAGMSFGQVTCQNAAKQLVQPQANVGFLMRAESEAENVSQTTLVGCISNFTAGTTVEVTMSLPVTSKAVAAPFPGAGNGAGNSEATLLINDNTANPQNANPISLANLATYVPYSGTAAGNLISFTNVTFPANYSLVLVDIRVNASLAGALNAVVPVTESIIVGQNGIAEYTAGATVGQVLRGLAPPTLVVQNATGGTLFLSNGSQSTSIAVCNGDPIGITAPHNEFQITVNEGFPGAFKLQTDPNLSATNQEQGAFINAPNGVGVASSATQITLTFANVPATATIYVPTTVSFAGNLTAATLTLLNSQVAATSPSGLTLIPGTNGPVAALPAAVGGIITAVYTVTATNALQQENFVIPVYLNLPATTAAAPLAAQGPITVLESFAPSGALPASGLANSVPIFATTTNTPINLQSIVLCNTTLLFPYVTNAAGYETGIAIANTTTDNLGFGGASSASPTNGTCTVNFYGGQTQPAAFTTPTMGAYAAGPPLIQPVYANTLSTMSGAAPGFSGYAIAQCNFLDAHGFAFILDASGTGSASGPEGYVAIVIPRGTTTAGSDAGTVTGDAN